MSRLPANVCSEHPNANLIEDSRAGDIICSECGLVVGDRVIDVTSEWRTFANDEGKDRSRVGAAQSTLLNSSDLSTVMQNPGGRQGWDIGNSSLMRSGRRSGQSDTAEERYLKEGYNEITKICEKGQFINQIQNKAKETFKQVSDKKLLKGKKRPAIAGACIFIACRELQVGRSFKEICAIAGITKSEIHKCFSKITKSIASVSTGEVEAGNNMHRHVSQLEPDGDNRANMRLAAIGRELAQNLNELGICDGRSPLSKDAAMLWMAYHIANRGNNRNVRPLREITRVIGVAEATIKNIYKIINDHGKINELIPDSYKASMEVTPEAMLKMLI